jgi:hypothetical protein
MEIFVWSASVSVGVCRAALGGGDNVMWFSSYKKVASQVMSKWLETAQIAAAAAESGTSASLIGKSVSMSDFFFEYGGVPPMIKVSVAGTGDYLGFRGDIMESGEAMVWFENGSRPGAKKLVNALCKMYPDLIHGNRFSERVNDFVRRFATR